MNRKPAMNHRTAQKLYPAYADGLLSESDRNSLTRHLAGCDRCRGAFELFDRSLAPGSSRSPRLSVDPYLPARVRAIASERHPSARRVWVPALRWSLGSIAFTLALALGVYLGQDLSRSVTPSAIDDPVSEFAASVSASDLSDRWSYAFGQNDGGQP